MIIKNLLNNGLAEVDDELGKTLIDGGGWEEAKAARRTRAKAAPVEEPKSEE